MNEVKYPVIVSVNGQQSYQWLTITQANERFVVVNNRLVVNNVEPLSIDYCQFLLEHSQKTLLDHQEEFEDLCSDIEQYQNNNTRLVSEYLQPKLVKTKETIKKYEIELDFLTKAIDFLNS
jgi:hypothetical protein